MKQGAARAKGAAAPDGLVHGLGDLGLRPYEARVLLALLRRGASNSVELAHLSGVPRTAVYPVLHGLESQGLVERLPGPGPAAWASRGRGEVISRLEAAEEERLRQHRKRAEEVRDLLDRSFPETPPEVPLPFVHVLDDTQAKARLEEVISAAEEDLLLFTRVSSPWADPGLGKVFDDLLSKGVKIRLLYQTDQWTAPAAEAFRTEMTRFHEAGAEGRMVDQLPAQMVLVDRKVTLAYLVPETGDGYPACIHIDHSEFAGVAATAFDQHWANSRLTRPAAHTRVRTRTSTTRPALRSAG